MERRQVVSWTIQGIGTIALMVGAGFIADVREHVRQGNKDLALLTTQVALLHKESERSEELRQQFYAHARELGHPHGVAAMVDRLRADLERLRVDVEALREIVSEHVGMPGHAVMVDRIESLSERMAAMAERLDRDRGRQ